MDSDNFRPKGIRKGDFLRPLKSLCATLAKHQALEISLKDLFYFVVQYYLSGSLNISVCDCLYISV